MILHRLLALYGFYAITINARIRKINADLLEETMDGEKNCPGNCDGNHRVGHFKTKLPNESIEYATEILTFVPELPSIICCDSSCPKCLGGLPPRPGSNQCQFGCPSGGCAGSCPCDQCVCCYTTTKYITSETTCLDFTTVQTIQEDTSTVVKFETVISEFTKPVTFTVLDKYVFTAYETFQSFATAPTFVTDIVLSASTVTSTVYADFSSVEATLTLTRFLIPTTVTTNPVSTVFTVQGKRTINERLFSSTIRTFGGFTFVPSSVFATTTVLGRGTFYQYLDASGTLSIPTATICGISSAIIFNYSGVSYVSQATVTETPTVSFSFGTSYAFTRPITTVTVEPAP